MCAGWGTTGVVQAHAGTDLVDADRDQLRMVLGDTELDLKITRECEWPKAFGGGGVFSSVPFLNQYWHPYRLGGKASGTVTCGEKSWTFSDATLYCERNWGAGFPLRWWWGQAHDFGEDDVCVAFSGGLLELGPLKRDVTGVVVRLEDRVLRITPPALVSSSCDGQRWQIDARIARYRVQRDGYGIGTGPHVLPVPMPAERRNIDTTTNIWPASCAARSGNGAASSSTAHRSWRASRSAADRADVPRPAVRIVELFSAKAPAGDFGRAMEHDGEICTGLLRIDTA
jgi:hypothetical protein